MLVKNNFASNFPRRTLLDSAAADNNDEDSRSCGRIRASSIRSPRESILFSSHIHPVPSPLSPLLSYSSQGGSLAKAASSSSSSAVAAAPPVGARWLLPRSRAACMCVRAQAGRPTSLRKELGWRGPVVAEAGEGGRRRETP